MAQIPPAPSPDGVATEDGAAPLGEVEAARSVLVPLATPTARLLAAWRTRRLLNRLALALQRDGWTVERRYNDSPAMLRVYHWKTPCIGDSITVVPGPGGQWYQSSTGDLLAPCSRAEVAVVAVSLLLRPWVAASSRRTDGA